MTSITSQDRITELRSFYAKFLNAVSGCPDRRVEQAFRTVLREAFLSPGPWKIAAGAEDYIETPSADFSYLYQDHVIALDASRGINNGQPSLHAKWVGATAPQPGETITHVGAGTGYYSAILSTLVQPGGHVEAFEFNIDLADAAMRNLSGFTNVKVTRGNAVVSQLQPSDIIYVNAGVSSPPVPWLQALKEGGRMIFPWRPSWKSGFSALISRRPSGFALELIGIAYFIPCIGAPDRSAILEPDYKRFVKTQSIHIKRDRQPDSSATAIYDDVWFSSVPIDHS